MRCVEMIESEDGDLKVAVIKHESRRGLRLYCFYRGGQRITQASDDAMLAEHNHGFKERRRDGLADERDARGVDQQASFHAFGLGEFAQHGVASVMIPICERGEIVGESRE